MGVWGEKGKGGQGSSSRPDNESKHVVVILVGRGNESIGSINIPSIVQHEFVFVVRVYENLSNVDRGECKTNVWSSTLSLKWMGDTVTGTNINAGASRNKEQTSAVQSHNEQQGP